MCRRVECPECGRPTFTGCGLHVQQVLGDVPVADRCPGHAPAPRKPQDGAQANTGARGWLRGLFGKP